MARFVFGCDRVRRRRLAAGLTQNQAAAGAGWKRGNVWFKLEKRIADRGGHTAPFATERDTGKIADAFRNAVCAETQDESFFGIRSEEFTEVFKRESNDLMWAPDGDAAFDDGSYVLQFDVGDRVRLIAFKSAGGYRHDPSTLRDVWLAANGFYDILLRWRNAFEAEWVSTPKSPDGESNPG